MNTMKKHLRLILAGTVLLWSIQSYAHVPGKKPGAKGDGSLSYDLIVHQLLCPMTWPSIMYVLVFEWR
jgi:hypothetical protein